MNDYERKLANRQERLLNAAARADERSTELFNAAHDAVKHIPFGQPILIGHHSEARHRRDLQRSDNHMRKSFEVMEYAKELERKAQAVGTGGISSDDPDAIKKLKEQLAERTNLQERMKYENKVIKKFKCDPEKVAQALNITTTEAKAIIGPNCFGIFGYASFELSNNNQQIHRIERRIKELEAMQKVEDKSIEGPGYKLSQDTNANRIYFYFECKPSLEIIKELKARAFKWTPSVGAWGRKITRNAIYDANALHRKFKEMNA